MLRAQFVPIGASPWNYNDTANWNGGTINGTFTQSQSAAQSVYFTAPPTTAPTLTFTLSGTAPSLALVGGSGDVTLTLGGDVTVNGTNNSITFGTGTTGSKLNVDLGGASRTFNVGSSNTLSFLDVISGSNALTKSGAGSLTLSGGNTYSGGTTITGGGNVYATNTTGSATGTSDVTISNGGLYIGNFGTAGSISGNIVLGDVTNAFVNFAHTNPFSYSGNITGTGYILNGGGSTLTLGGANTFTGNTTISSGTLADGVAGALSPNSAIFVNSNSHLNINYDETVAGLTGNASGTVVLASGTKLTINNASPGTLATPISGGGSIIKAGNGTEVLSGTNSYTGTTTVNAGVLQFAKETSLYGGTTASWTATNLVVASGATAAFNVGGTGEFTSADIDIIKGLGSASGGFQSGSALGLDTTNGGFTYASAIANPNGGANNLSLIKSGTGTLTLTGANTYTGGTTVNAGELQIGNGGTTGSVTGNITITSPGVVRFNHSDDINYGGVISGTGQLYKSGTGTLTLTNNNTYTYGAWIYAGTLSVGTTDALGTTASVAVTVNGTLDVANSQISKQLTGLGAVIVGSGKVFTLTSGTGTGYFTGTLNGSGTTVVSGGTFDTYTGSATLSGGTLQIGNGGATGALTGNFVNNSSLVFNRTGAITYGDVVSGTGTLTKTGTGTLTLSGANTYNGATTISGGMVSVGTLANGGANSGIGAADNTAANLVLDGGTLQYTGTAVTTDRLFTVGTTAGSALDASGAGTLTLSNIGAIALSGTNTARTFTLTGTGAGSLAAVISDNGTGATALTKSGTGTWTLSGANSYTGATTVSAGALNLQNSTATGTTAGGVTVTSGAALELQGSIAVGAEALTISGTGVASNGALRNISGTNSWAGAVTLGAASEIQSDAGTLTVSGAIGGATNNLTVDGAGNTTLSGVIGTTTGTLTKTGAGTLTLSGANTYTGATTISQGTLLLNANAPSGSAGTLGNATSAVTVNDTNTGTGNTALLIGTSGVTVARDINVANQGTGTTTLGGNITSGTGTFSGNATLNKSATINADGTSNITFQTGVISGTGTGLTKTGTGTVTLSGTNTFTGATTINAGTLAVGADANLGTAPGSATAGQLTLNGGTLNTSATFTLSSNRGVALGASGGTFSPNTGTTLTFGGIIAGTGSLTQAGAGTLTLSGTNTYSGATTVSAGTLSIGTDLNLGAAPGSATANKLTLNGGTLNTSATFTLSSNRGVALGASGGTFSPNTGTTLTYGGIIAGTGSLTQAGAGTLTLSGTNTYTGNTTVSAGTLVVSGDANLGTAPGTATPGKLTLNGGTLNNSTNLTLNANRGIALGASGGTFNTNSNTTLTYGGIIAGSGSLTKSGAGTLTLSGNNTFSGTTTLSAGSLNISSEANLGATPSSFAANQLTVNGATLNTAANLTLSANRGILLGASGGTFGPNAGITLTVDGVISGTGTLIKNNAGALTLTAANTYTNTTFVGNSTLNIGNGTSGSLNGTSGTALTFNNIGGTFNVFEAPGSNQGMGALSFTLGEGNVQSTYPGSGTTTLTFSNVAARSAGATGNFSISGGANGTTNKIVFTQFVGGAPITSALLDKGLFFGGSSYAAYDSGGFVRAYGSGDTGYVAAPAGASLGTVTTTSNVDITGAISAQPTAAVNTIRDAGANSIALATGATLSTNGILKSGGSAATISGGTAVTSTTSSGEIVVRTDASGDVLTIATPITNTGTTALTKSGLGTLTLSAANAFTGTTTLDAGTLALTNSGALQVSTLSQMSGATLAFTNGITSATVGGLTSTGGSPAIALTNDSSQPVALTIGNSTTTYAGVLSGSGSLIKTGGGTTTLSGTNTYTGTTTINGGTLAISSDLNLGAVPGSTTSGSLTLNGGTLNPTATLTLSANRGIAIGNAGGTFSVANGTILTYGGTIVGTGALTKSSAGTLTLSGNNSFTAFTISQGSANLTGNTSSTGLTSITNGTLTIGSGTAGTLNGTAGTALTFSNVGGTFNVKEGANSTQGMGTVTLSAGDSTIGSYYPGSGNTVLTIADLVRSAGATGNFVMSGGATGTTNKIVLTKFAGSTPSPGGVEKGLFFGGSSYATLDSGGFVRAYGSSDTATGYVAAPASTTFGAVTNSSNVDVTGAISAQTSASVNTIRDAGANNITLASGATLGTDGILKSGGNAATISGGTALTTNTPGSEMVIRTDVSTDSLTINTPIADNITASSLTKSGLGTLTLGAANTYTGATTIDSGTLTLNTTNALSSSTAVNVGGLGTFNVNGMTDTIGSLTGSGALNLGAGALTVGSNSTSTSFSGVISGTGTLAKTGTGTLTLSGTNTYTGGTTVSAGTLAISSDGNLGGTASTLTLNGGTLNNTSSTTLNAARGVTIGASGGTLNTGANLTYAGTLAGSGALTKSGTSTLTLSGTNTSYNGAITVSAGTLAISADNNLGAAPGSATPDKLTLSGGTLNNTATLTLDSNRGVTLGASGGTVNTSASTTLTYAGILAGSGNLTKSGTGALTLSGANTFTGGVTVSAGTLTLSGTNVYTGTTTISGGTLNLGDGTSGSLNGATTSALTFSNTGGAFIVNQPAGSSQGMGTLSLSAGDGSVQSTYPGTGTTTLTFANATRSAGATGNFVASGGASNKIVLTQFAGAAPTTGTVLNKGLFFGGGNYATYDSAGYVRAYGAGDTGYVGSVSGTSFGSVTSSSNVELSGSVTAQPTATVNTIRDPGAFDITLAAGATLGVDGILKTGGNGATLSGGTALTATASGSEIVIRTDTANDSLTISTPIANAGSSGSALTKSGLGTLTLAAANTYSGTTYVDAGTLVVANSNALQNSGVNQVAGANVIFNGITAATFGSLTSSSTGPSLALVNDTGAPVALTLGGNNSSVQYTGVLSGSGSLTKVGTGTFTPSGTNTYTGPTTINAGTLIISSDANLGAVPTAPIAGQLTLNGGTLNPTTSLTLNANRGIVLGASGGTFNVSSGTLTYGGIIAGSGGLTKSNSGTLTLSGANTYTGTTMVFQGTVNVSGSLNGTTGTALTFNNVGGLFNVNAAGSFTQGMGLLTFTGGDATVRATAATGAATTLSFTNVAPRTSGATATFSLSSGSGASNSLVLSQVGGATPTPGSLLDRGFFFSDGVNPASYAAVSGTGAVRAYGSGDTGYVSAPAGSTFGSVTSASNVDVTGAISAQTTATVSTIRDAGTNNIALAGGATLSTDGILKSGSGTAVISGGTGLTTAMSGGELVIRTDASGDTLTVNTPILANGTNSLTKTGAGTLTLGAANTYSGLTTITAGTMAVADANALQFSSVNAQVGPLTFSGITAATIGGLSGSWGFSLANTSAAAVALSIGNNNGNTGYGGVLSGAGSVVKVGTGTLTLSGANTYTGGTTINSGFLSITSDGNLGSTSGTVTLNGGTLVTAATSSFTLNASRGFILGGNGGTISVSGSTPNVAGVISGSGSLTKAGSGQLTLSGTNTYSGATTISAGTLAISLDTHLGTAPSLSAVPGQLTFAGGTLNTTGNMTLDANRGIAVGSTAIFNTAAGTTLTYGGLIAGSGGLTKSTGTGTLTLSGANIFTGTTTVSAGTLAISNSKALQNSTVSVGAAGTLAFSGGITAATFGNLSGAGNLSLTNDSATPAAVTLTAGSSNATATYSGALSGAGSLTKTGSSTLTLSGANTYTGTTTVQRGTLTVTGSLNGTSGTALTFNGAGGTFNVSEADGVSQGMGLLTFSGGSSTVQSTYPSSGTLNTKLTFADVAARASGAGAQFFASGGTSATNQIVLSKFKGTQTSDSSVYGTLLDRGLTFNDSGNTTRYAAVSSNGLVRAYGPGDANYAVASDSTTFGAVGSGSNVDITGAITVLTNATVNTIRDVGPKDITLAGGVTLAVDGILKVGNNAATISGGAGLTTATSGGELVIFTDLTDDSLTIATPILAKGTSSLTKLRGGTLTLTGNNTYTGNTVINGGTLAISADTNLGSAVTPGQIVLANGTLETTASVILTSGRGIVLSAVGYINTDAGTTLTYGGTISGDGHLNKSGKGTLVLLGAYTSTGTMAVTDGSLQVGDGTTGSLVAAGTNFNFSSAGGNFIVNEAANSTQSMGLLGFNGGEGNVQSTYAGSGNTALTFVNLAPRSAGATGNFVTSGGTNGTTNSIVLSMINGAAPATLAGTLLDKGLFFGGGSYATVGSSGVVRAYTASDANGATLSGGGTTLGVNDSAANIFVSGGGVTAQTTAAVNTIINNGANNLTLSGSQTLSFNGFLQTGGTLSVPVSAKIDGGTGALLQPATSGGEIVIRTNTGYDSLRIDSVIQNNATASRLTKAGSGTLTLSAANTYTGATAIDAGTLAIANSNALASSSVAINDGALTFTGGITSALLGGLSSVTTTAAVALTNDASAPIALTVGNNNASTTYSGVLSGTGSLIKTGTGTLTLSGANTYTGGTTVTGGTLQLSRNAVLAPNSAIVINNPTGGPSTFSLGNNVAQMIGSLYLGGAGASATTTNNVTLGTNATLTLGGNVTFDATGNPNYATISGGALDLGGATRTFDVGNTTTFGSDLVISSAISGNGGITKTGAGALKLENTTPSTYTGDTTVNAGSLFLAANNTIPAASKVIVNSTVAGGTANLNIAGGIIQTIGDLVFGGAYNSSNDTVTLGTLAVLTLGGKIQYNAANNPLGASISGGALDLGSSSHAFDIGYSSSATGAATPTPELTISSNISGTGSSGFNKTGAGALFLSGANTYTGATTLTAGRLIIGASTALPAASPLTLSGGILAMGGAYTESLGALTLTANSTIDFGSYAASLSFTSSSGLWTTGTTLSVTNYSTSASHLYFGTDSTALTIAQLNQITINGQPAVWLNPSISGEIGISAIPEPSTYAALFGVGVLAFAVYHRRNRKRVQQQ